MTTFTNSYNSNDSIEDNNTTTDTYNCLLPEATQAKQQRIACIINQLADDLKIHTSEHDMPNKQDINALVNYFYEDSFWQQNWESATYQTLIKMRIAANQAKQHYYSDASSTKKSIVKLNKDSYICAKKLKNFSTLSIDYLYQLTKSSRIWISDFIEDSSYFYSQQTTMRHGH